MQRGSTATPPRPDNSPLAQSKLTMRTTTYFFLAALGLSLSARPANAQVDVTYSCGATPTGHAEWPSGSPLWTFDFVNAPQSSGANGSGLELRNVYYDGHLVFGTAHVPILNVEYDGSGCSCFRDWFYQEAGFAADGIQPGSCLALSTPGIVETTCDSNEAGGSGGDPGSFTGTSFEDFGNELVLTSNQQAGWYRYRMKWHFYVDGRIWPEFSFSAASATCTNQNHRHHAYWRFDFDLDGTDSDVVKEINPTAGTETTFVTEDVRTWGNPSEGIFWDVRDANTGFGYQIVPGSEDLLLPVDSFSKLDAAIAVYDPDEIDDGDASLGDCAIIMDSFPDYDGNPPIVNGESVMGEDIVFWYRSSAVHTSGNPWECDIVGPTLFPISATDTTGPPPGEELPNGYILERAYPNPFNPSTTLRFKVAEGQNVTVVLIDALGRQVAELFNSYLDGNKFESVRVDGSNLPSGAYTVRLDGESVQGSTRVVLIK